MTNRWVIRLLPARRDMRAAAQGTLAAGERGRRPGWPPVATKKSRN